MTSVSILRRSAKAALILLLAVASPLFSASAMGSVTWSPSRPLNSDSALYSGVDEIKPVIGGDGTGNFMVAWTTASGVFAAMSHDGGTTWQPETTILRNTTYSALRVQNVVYAGDAWLVYWRLISPQLQTNLEISNVARTTDGVNWTVQENLNQEFYTGFSAGLPNMELNGGDMDSDGNGTVLVILEEDLLARSTDAGASWTTASLPVGAGSYQNRRLQLESAGEGKWYIAMSNRTADPIQNPVPYSKLLISADNGLTWSVRDTTANFAAAMGLAVHGNTVVVANWPNLNATVDDGVTWTGLAGGGSGEKQTITADAAGNFVAASGQILTNTSNPIAGWGPPVDTSVAGNSTGEASIAAGPGRFVMVRTLTPDSAPWPGPEADVFAQISTNGGTTWDTPAIVNIAGADDVRDISDRHVQMVAGDNGVVLASWVAEGGPLMLARSSDHGETWSDPEVIHSWNTSPHWGIGGLEHHILAYAGSGRWLVAWDSASDPYWFDYVISDDDGLTWNLAQRFFGDVAEGSGEGTLIKGQDHEPPHFALARMGRDASFWEEPTIIDHKPREILYTGNNNWLVLADGGHVYTSDDDGRTWTLQTNTVNVPPAAATRLAADANGTVMALSRVLEAGNTFHVYSRKSADSGVTWTHPVLVGTFAQKWDTVADRWGDVVSPEANQWVAVLGAYRSEAWTVRSVAGGDSWTTPAPLPRGANEASDGYRNGPVLTLSGSNLIAAWDNHIAAHTPVAPSDIHYSLGKPTPSSATDWQLFE